jgi:hypothetical protein
MQDVFEDGPKRDRRLWLGDLRLEALSNYYTFRNDDLVKRCLYLFAGSAGDDGRLSACVFTEPFVTADDTYMFDYALLFIPILLDYLEHTGDTQTAKDLLFIALRQLENSQSYFNNERIICDSDTLGWCFLDWRLELNKQAGAQAVYIYSAKAAVKLCRMMGMDTALLEKDVKDKSEAALRCFFDKDLGLFVSGQIRKLSYATNVWFVLAEVLPQKDNAALLTRLEQSDALRPVTPYMMHHYVQALINAGHSKKAHEVMTDYWGGMIADGADTYYELYNPQNPKESPYGSAVINSYCHAWSCTPSYFLRRYFVKG